MAEPDYMPASRAEAIRNGSTKFFTGRQCKRGHLTFRYTVDHGCAECGQMRKEARRLTVANDPALLEKQRLYHRQHKASQRQSLEGKRAHYEANRRYIEKNRDKIAAYYNSRRRSDPTFAMASWMRSNLHKVLNRANRRKDARCVEMMGFTGAQLRAHIESQFVKGMTWANRGEWEVDHIIPVAEWLRRGETNPAVINRLSNLRPMWARDNRAKSDKVQTLV